jgi:ABC-2 type transport system permease protein
VIPVAAGLLMGLGHLASGAAGASTFTDPLGTLLNLPAWLVGISPYSHLPWVPGQTATAGRLVALTAIAVVLAVVGLLGLRRRDLVG